VWQLLPLVVKFFKAQPDSPVASTPLWVGMPGAVVAESLGRAVAVYWALLEVAAIAVVVVFCLPVLQHSNWYVLLPRDLQNQ